MTLTLYWGKRHPSSTRGQPKFTIIKQNRLTDLYRDAPRWQHTIIKDTEAELAYLRRQIKTIGKVSLYLTQLEVHVRRNYRRLIAEVDAANEEAFKSYEFFCPNDD